MPEASGGGRPLAAGLWPRVAAVDRWSRKPSEAELPARHRGTL